MRKISSLLLIALLPLLLKAEDKFGPNVNLGWNHHIVDFQKIPGTENCCSGFESGSGFGTGLGAYYMYELSTSFNLNFNAGYTSLSSYISRTQEIDANLIGTPEKGEFEYSLDADISAVNFAVLPEYKFSESFFAFFGVGLNYILSASYVQQEELTQPENRGVFKDENSRIRNDFSGDIPDMSSISTFLRGGLRLEFPLNEEKDLLLSPELNYEFALTDVHQDLSWKANSLRFGLSLLFSTGETVKEEAPEIEKEESKEEEVIAAKTKVPEVKELEPVKIDVKPEYKEDSQDKDRMLLSKSNLLNINPILPFVFFSTNSSTIPERYTFLTPAETNDFNPEQMIFNDDMEVYHHILNIIAYRLKKYENANITLAGCNDNDEEKDDLELSKTRTENVRKYFLNVWNIDDSRIKIEYRNLPEKPSNPETKDGKSENRRVEIQPDDERIIEPLKTRITNYNLNVSNLIFNIENKNNVKSWNLEISNSKEPVYNRSGEENIPETISWTPAMDDIDTANPDIFYSFSITDKNNKEAKTEGKIDIDKEDLSRTLIAKREGDKIIERYNLILFDFNSAEIKDQNQIVIDMINESVKDAEHVAVKGYTDRTGDSTLNKNLSKRRAENTAKNINYKSPEIIGYGEEIRLYDNDLPEGRFLNRKVIVNVVK